jgi:mannose-6-phosphate isomerase-like protein (cupin superfamily)
MDGLGDIRRVVTGHNAEGTAVVLQDGPTPHTRVRPGRGNVSRLLWVTRESPADIEGDADRAEGFSGTAPPPRGSVLRVVDFPPVTDAELAQFPADYLAREHGGLDTSGRRAPSHPFMHRTDSVDYAIVLQGEIDMKLDDEWIRLKAGDVLVQQATNHAWMNRGTGWARVAFVLLDAKG